MGTDKYAQRSSLFGKKGSRPRGATEARDEFVRLELDKTQTADYRRWRDDIGIWADVLQEMLEDGYKFTLRWDDYSASPAAFAFPGDDHDNRGYILSGRGGTVLKALTELLYKHSVLLTGVWTGGLSASRPKDDPDW